MEAWGLIIAGAGCGFALLVLWRMLVGMVFPRPSVQVHFSPKGGCTEAIVAHIRRARSEILVLAYSFTSRPITDALVEAHLRGVRLEIILDHSNEKEPYTDLPHLLEQGIRPLIDPNHPIAHNKVMVIDGYTVLTGSFNFTHQAENENAENLLVLQGHSELVASYRQNFREHRAHSRPASTLSATHIDAHRGAGHARRAA